MICSSSAAAIKYICQGGVKGERWYEKKSDRGNERARQREALNSRSLARLLQGGLYIYRSSRVGGKWEAERVSGVSFSHDFHSPAIHLVWDWKLTDRRGSEWRCDVASLGYCSNFSGMPPPPLRLLLFHLAILLLSGVVTIFINFFVIVRTYFSTESDFAISMLIFGGKSCLKNL